MAVATTAVATEHGSHYLQQLCKHVSHKFTVSFDPAHGMIALPNALLALDADATSLALGLSGPKGRERTRMCNVVADHLRRFAFREELAFDWTGIEA